MDMVQEKKIFYAPYAPETAGTEVLPKWGEKQQITASIYPVTDSDTINSYGLTPDKSHRLILRGAQRIFPQDGVWMDGDSETPEYTVVSAVKWRNHTSVLIKAVV